MPIKKVLIVGSGTLGQQIGFQCAMHGFATTMYDLRQESLEACRASHRQYADMFTSQRGKSKVLCSGNDVLPCISLHGCIQTEEQCVNKMIPGNLNG